MAKPIDYGHELNTIITGDAIELCRSIPDDSIDLILCDPVYNHPEQYAWLVRLAGRVLRYGGSLVAQSGHIYRFECETVMANLKPDCLQHRPLITEVFTGGFASIWMHKTHRASHPYIWFEKCGYGPKAITRQSWIPTMFFGSRDKSHHEWGDGERAALYMIQRFTNPGDVILDPFAGSGTVTRAAKMLGRNCISFEIDQERADVARRLLAETNPPLMVLDAIQNELIAT